MAVKTNDSNALYKYIYDKCKKGEPGFYPFEIPTGHGKTTAMVSAISDLVAEDESRVPDKYFVVSAKIANLKSPYKDFCEFLGADKVLFLKNISETTEDFFEAVKTGNVTANKLIGESEQYADLEDAYKSLSSAKGIKGIDASVVKELENKVREKYANLRAFIITAINSKISESKPDVKRISNEDRKTYIEDHMEEWEFLYSLFPSMRMDTSNVILLTVDKLAHPLNSPTQSYKGHLYDEFCAASGDFHSSTIFFDESDEDFRQLKGAIIDAAAKEDSDIIRMIRNVYTPRVHKRKDFLDKADTPAKDLKEFYDDLLNRIFKKYHLGYTFRTSDEARNDLKRRFLFRSEIEAKLNVHNCLFVHFNGKENLIYSAEAQKDESGKTARYDVISDKDYRLSQVAYDIYYFLVFDTTNFIERLAGRYSRTHTIDFTNAATTIMRMMEFDESTISFIKNNMAPNTSEEVNKKALLDSSFYENGTASSIIVDAQEHNEDTEVKFYVCSTTPEKIIADMSEQIRVWGISATALNESSVMNGNMRWIETRLGSKFHAPTKEELDTIKKQAEKDWDFTGVHYKVSPHWFKEASQNERIPIRAYAKKQISKLFAWRVETGLDEETKTKMAVECAAAIVNILVAPIKDNIAEANQHYILDRYLELLNAWKEYIIHPDADSALFFGNRYLTKGDVLFDSELIDACRIFINRYYNYTEDPDGEFVALTTKDLKDENRTALNKLDTAFLDGKRRFVYTIYRAAGTGQNLQHKYKCKDSLLKVAVNRCESEEKDYDMIFLSAPTHVVENLFGDKTESTAKSMLELLYQCESLRDSYSGELTVYEEARILEARATGEKPRGNSLKGKDSEVFGAFNMMVQAIGRIGRSPYRNRNVYIYLSVDAAKAFARVDETAHYFSKELTEVLFSDIVNDARTQAFTEDVSEEKRDPNEEGIERWNRAPFDTINRCKKRKPDVGFLNMQEWKDIREAVLRNITTKEEWTNLGQTGRIMYFYKEGLTLNDGDYSYSVEASEYNDHKDVTVSLDPMSPKKIEVSSIDSRLADILLVDGVRKHFEDNGYRTDLNMKNFIMPPVVYNNIFKGVIAEEAGMLSINRDAKRRKKNVRLIDIDDPLKFEMFDAVFEGTDVYVDFKNYKEDTQTVAEDVIKGEYGGVSKARKIGAKTIIYIAITSEKKYPLSDDIIDGVRVIQLPGLYTIKNGVAVRNDEFFKKMYEAAGANL